MTKQMINPAQYIAFVDALNELEQKARKINKFGLGMETFADGIPGFEDYSIQWDSEAARWTLVSETDEAPDLCSFNQTRDECSETDPCEQCYQVQVELAEEYDNETARRGY
ncbi:hypothetical protein SEA_LAZERLEMON_81 [Streptomyces phage LazerLemon]|nr:hypothetical protein SEA_LAZERLEMON_81 [Streptomyces phage LazerLemon]